MNKQLRYTLAILMMAGNISLMANRVHISNESDGAIEIWVQYVALETRTSYTTSVYVSSGETTQSSILESLILNLEMNYNDIDEKQYYINYINLKRTIGNSIKEMSVYAKYGSCSYKSNINKLTEEDFIGVDNNPTDSDILLTFTKNGEDLIELIKQDEE